ncbi:S1C family serine protease [Rubritalea marina]|uniref:S1C family serine protease n=1 Tax=Rubritalea marina TaxID=361055 RepID=UPI0003752179|nr:PDZ domain-containing protein [Rubritalea marina]
MKPFLTLLLAVLTTLGSLSSLAADYTDSVLRISSTLQNYNPSQPWDKSNPRSRRALAAVLDNGLVITTAEMVTNANFIQLETCDGEFQIPAKIHTIDYECNLALLEAIDADGKEVIAKLKPFQTAEPASIGDSLDIIQIQNNGTQLLTSGKIRGVDIVAGFAAGHYFLNYELKTSMQSAANSFTLPAIKDGKLAGLLTSYSSKDQLADLIAPEILNAFLEDAADGAYKGFPMLGVATSNTKDPHFRRWLELPQGKNGLFITRVLPDSAAANAKLQKGDVITAIDGHAIDKRGNYQDPHYGTLFWSHLVRGAKKIGEPIHFDILRDGKVLQVETKLARAPEGIIPSHTYGKAPRYLVKGGFVFQELTKSYLEAFGKDWQSRAPLNLLDALNHPEDYEKGRDRLVFISATIPTPATLGYESIRGVIVEQVNGQPVKDLPSLIAALKKAPANGIHSLTIDEQPKTIYLDATLSDQVDQQLVQRGLPALSRAKE